MEKQKKLSKKQQLAQEEEKIKKNYSEKAYLQRLLDRELKGAESIKFSQKFMLIAFGVFSVILFATLFVDFKIFWLVLSIIFTCVFIASVIWAVVYKVKFKPIKDEKIASIRAKLKEFNDIEQEKLQKIQSMLNKQKNQG